MEQQTNITITKLATLSIIFLVLNLFLFGFFDQVQKRKLTPLTAEAVVNITSAGFTPATVKIKKGQQVRWVNQDVNPHQIAFDPYPIQIYLSQLETEPLATNESLALTFEARGVHTYYDNFDPQKITGIVLAE